MTTGKLIWGMIWRSIAFGISIGALTGIVLGILGAIGYLLIYAIQSQTSVGYALVPAIMMGAFDGLIYGSIISLILGFIGGIAAGFVTRLFFFPLRNPNRLYRVARLVGGLFGAVGISLILYPFLDILPDLKIRLIVWVIFALIAGFLASYICQLLARWYERESAKGIAPNVSAN